MRSCVLNRSYLGFALALGILLSASAFAQEPPARLSGATGLQSGNRSTGSPTGRTHPRERRGIVH